MRTVTAFVISIVTLASVASASAGYWLLDLVAARNPGATIMVQSDGIVMAVAGVLALTVFLCLPWLFPARPR